MCLPEMQVPPLRHRRLPQLRASFSHVAPSKPCREGATQGMSGWAGSPDAQGPAEAWPCLCIPHTPFPGQPDPLKKVNIKRSGVPRGCE